MIKDLDQIYDPEGINNGTGDGTGDPKPKPKLAPAEAYLQQRKNFPQNMARAGSTFKVAGVEESDQQKFFGDTGIADPALTGQDIALEAGARQSFGNKLGRRLVNLVPNVAADLLDMAGSITSLLTEWGDERDYRNALNDAADAIKNPAGENYKRSNDTWAIGDPTWWIDNAFNTIEFAGAYALGGVGVAKGFGALAKGLGEVTNAGAKGMQWINEAAKLGTSAVVSYAQGAQDGATVFKEVYDNQLIKLMADGKPYQQAADEAKHIAAQSAASTAQLATLLTMGINYNAYGPMFRSQESLAKEIIAGRVAAMEGEAAGSIGKAIRGLNAEDYADMLMHHKGVLGVLNEMVREGGEEVLQQFAQQTGSDMGNKGKVKGFLDQFGEIENLIDRVGNSQGLFAFTLGAAFGGLQHTLIHSVIPSKQIEAIDPGTGQPIMRSNGVDDEGMRDKDGNPVFQKRWVTPRKYEYDMTQKSFDRVRDAAAEDFENFSDLHNQFLAAHQAKDKVKMDEIRDEMFNPGKLYAVRTGMTEPWKKTFEQIANLSPEQAVQAGFSTGADDVEYKQRAQEAMGDIDHLKNTYEKIQKQFGTRYEENQGLVPFVDMIFARTADIYSSEKRLKRYEMELEQNENQEFTLGYIDNAGAFDQASAEFIKKHNSAKEVGRQIDQDLMQLESILQNPTPEDVKGLQRLLKKYRAIGYGTGNINESVKDLIGKLKVKKAQLDTAVTTAEQTLLNTTDYAEWIQKPGNEKKKFDDYMKEVNKRQNLNVQNRFMRASLDEARTQLDIMKENLTDMTSEKNATRFMRKATEWAKSLEQEGEAIEKEKNIRLAAMTKDKATLQRLKKIETNQIAEKYRADRDIVHANIAENEARIAGLRRELDRIKGDPMRASAIKKQLQLLEKEQTWLINRAQVLDSLFRKTRRNTKAKIAPIPVEKVTGDENGKVTTSTKDVATTATEPIEASDFIGEDVVGDTIDEQVADIEKATKFATIEDELAAMRKDIAAKAEADQAFDDAEEYANLLNKMHPKVRKKMNTLVNDILVGKIGFSLDALNEEINQSLITQPAAHKLLLAARDYITSMNKVLAEPSKQNLKPDENPIQEGDTIIVKPPSPPDTPIIESDPAIVGKTPEGAAYHAGFKIIEAATSGATSTIGYEEGTRKGKNGELIYVKVTKPTELLRPANKQILLPGGLPAGHPLIYEVDWNYEGPSLVTDQLSWDGEGNPSQGYEKGSQYLDENGKVKNDTNSIGNVPIRVKDGKTGEYLFHIHKMDWINAKYPNTKDYRNIVDTIHLKDGTVIDNLAIQRNKLLAMRLAIVDKFNADGTATEGKMSSAGKGTGRLILNHVVENRDDATMAINSKVVPKLAYNKSKPDESMLPQYDLEVVIVGNDGMPKSGKDFTTTKPLGINPKDLVKGAVGAMVPAANGQFMYAPLIGMKLVEPGKPSPALSSVVRALELYILNDGTDPNIRREIDDLQKNTNFDVGTARGLKAFINQYYTYTQDFQDSALSPNAETGIKTEQFVFGISDAEVADKTKQIKAGFTMRGDGVQYANVVDGALSESFVNMIAEGFSQRSRAVVYTDPTLGIKGINSTSTFYDAVYVSGKGWKHNQHDSYNRYVMSFSRTPVYGRNTIGEGKDQRYVYTANPHLNIEMGREKKPTKQNKSITKTKTPPKPFESAASAFDDLANFSYRVRNTEVEAIGDGSENSKPLTFANLEEKYNFTPESQRNGRTVQEVMDDLNGRGHTFISDGYNPFSRCL